MAIAVRTTLFVIVGAVILVTDSGGAQPVDYHTRITLATYRISGPSETKPGLNAIGTAFLVAVPAQGNVNQVWGVLVTAKHILSEITGSVLRVDVRPQKDFTQQIQLPVNIRLADGSRNLYVEHPTEDVAAVLLPRPPDDAGLNVIPFSWLAEESALRAAQLHPGDVVHIVGFPRGTSFFLTLPITRQGIVASFPTPPVTTRLLISGNLQAGDNGAPVYVDAQSRTVNGTPNALQAVIGMYLGQYGNEAVQVGNVAPANIVRDTIAKIEFPAPK